jgi:PAS domain S-box-containing protein
LRVALRIPPRPGGREEESPPEDAGRRGFLPPDLLQAFSSRRGVPDDRSTPRLALYLGLAVLLGSLAVWAVPGRPAGSAALHSLFESAAAALAVVIGALALLRFYSAGRSVFLFVGVGFLGAAVLDAYGAALARMPPAFAPDGSAHPVVWAWIASQSFLALHLFAGSLVRDRGSGLGTTSPRARRVAVYLTSGLLLGSALFILGALEIPDFHAVDRLPVRLLGAAPALTFVLAIAGYLHRGRWREASFEHWLLLALITGAMAHGAFLLHSQAAHDAAAVAAHLGKVGTYLLILVGFVGLVHVAFRREAEPGGGMSPIDEALAREVETRRRAEAVLKENEERLRDFLDHANDLIQSTDPDGRILYVNESWKRTLGYGREELQDRDVFSIVHPLSREVLREAFRRALRGETVSGFEVVFQSSSGAPVVLSGTCTARRVAGRPGATRTIFRDVTEQVRTARELDRSQANLRALFESTGDAIWSVDPEHRLITFNSAFALTVEAVTGRAPQPGDSVQDVVASWEVSWFRSCYERALAGSRFTASREEKLGGELRTYELYFHPFEMAEGPGGVVVFSKDVTRRRQVEEALRRAKRDAEEANRAKSHFMANMSHELRTPLNSVIGFSNLLLRDGAHGLDERGQEFLRRIQVNGKHLLSLINQILDLAKIEAGKMELEIGLVRLQELVPWVLTQLEGQVGDRPVELRHDRDVEPAPLQTDEGKLRQVLINLVGNAVKFTREGTVSVEVEAHPDSRVPLRLHVRDTGIGIPENRLQAIFEAFRQADGTTSRRYGGTGLGLTISRSLCSFMGYGLTVESEEGKGSVFTIHFDGAAVSDEPEHGNDEEGEKDPGPPPTPSGGSKRLRSQWPPASSSGIRRFHNKRILVVDGDTDSRGLLAHYLEDLGCLVTTAESGSEALERARAEPPDLITTDLVMSGMSGWELLQGLRAEPELRDVPVVMVALVEGEASAHEHPGPLDILPRPVDRDELLRALGRNMHGGSGRVLVVGDDRDTRHLLQRLLREAGLVAHTVEDGEAARAFLQRLEVDLVLLDLTMPVLDGLALVRELRRSETGAGIPVVVLSGRDPTPEERERLRKAPPVRGYKNARVAERLRTVLEEHFRARRTAE